MRHRLSLESRQIGQTVTCGKRTLATTSGGNVRPTGACQTEKLWRQFFSVVRLQAEEVE